MENGRINNFIFKAARFIIGQPFIIGQNLLLDRYDEK